MKITLFNVPGHGHVNPTLAVVAELVRRGHHVIYYNTPEFASQIEQTGAEFRPYPEPNHTSVELAKLAENLVQVTLFILEESRRLLPFVLAELEQEQPNLVIYDSICLWGMQAARWLNLPTAASITTFVTEGVWGMLNWRDYLALFRHALPRLPRLFKLRRALVKEYGPQIFPEKQMFPVTGDLTLVFTSRAFQPETPFIDGRFHFIGPSIDIGARPQDDMPLNQQPDAPLIYVSLGTLYSHNRFDFYSQCFTAFADFPAQFVLSAGRTTDLEALPPAPANFTVRPVVPQLRLLQQADLFISHGGMNSVNESLYHSVPLVLVPQQMEQALNARQVERSGAGVILGNTPPYGRTQPHELRQAVEQVLHDPAYREAAAEIGRSFRQAGGYQRAADLLEAMLPAGKTESSLHQIKEDK